MAETAAIMRAHMTAPAPLTIAAIAKTFDRGGTIEYRVAVAIQALTRLGHVATMDGGDTLALQRVG